MKKNLAIKGHATRGEEVIELLGMLGGSNDFEHIGNNPRAIYYIDETYENFITCSETKKVCDCIIFTLEEFLEKYPYKVGDKVYNIVQNENQTITKLTWQEDEVIYQTNNNEYVYVNYLQPYKEAQMYLNEIANKRTEEIVQALKPAKEIMDRKYNVEEYLKVWEETEKGLEVVVNDRFELKEDNGKFYIIKKPVQYPNTYEGCCGIMGITYQEQLSYPNTDVERGNTYLIKEKQLLDSLKRLRICRNAYWKIIGEDMRLGEPWEPNWNNDNQFKYIISCRRDKIIKDTNTAKNSILAFPTEKIRDTFYENFKDLIEECKQFL